MERKATPDRFMLARKYPAGEPEAKRAMWWRQHRMGMSRQQLSDATGFSVGAIKTFESGRNCDEQVWRRYRLVCAAIAAGLVPDWRVGPDDQEHFRRHVEEFRNHGK